MAEQEASPDQRDVVEASPIGGQRTSAHLRHTARLSPLGRLPVGTPLVGRADELDFLKDQFEAVATGSGGRLLLIGGEPGVGKTRLARELGLYARFCGASFLEGR